MRKIGVSRRTFLGAGSLFAAAAGFSSHNTAESSSLVSSNAEAPASQAPANRVQAALDLPLQKRDVVETEIREYLMTRVRPLPDPPSATAWTADQKQLRKRLLDNVIFAGWPKEWVNSPPKFEDLGLIPSGGPYRLRKLRYEIVPQFMTTALLREPENPKGKCPATINLNGHDPSGKAAKYEQKRCINNALQGMYALSLEWLGMGEMACPENDHWNGSHLNLLGVSATGLFYLAIRRGLDYLCQHPNVDASRIGVTGLSGGAWQSIIIASLDERIAAAVPACGYFAFTSAIERNSDVGDMEYHPHDLFLDGGDYSTLTAMMAPRPTMLIYGALDQYGLRAPLEKPHLYDDIKPFFKLYGRQDDFVWHENLDPGTHNYELDNRQQSYAFFNKHFNLPLVQKEIPVDSQLKTYNELKVGLPDDNLTIITLAQKMAATIRRSAIPKAPVAKKRWENLMRPRLRRVVRYSPVGVKHAWPRFSDRDNNIESLAYSLQFTNDLSATALWLNKTTTGHGAPVVILLDDTGKRPPYADSGSQSRASSGLNHSSDNTIDRYLDDGKHVIPLNLVFTGDASPDFPKNGPIHVPEVYQKLYTSPEYMPGVISWLKTRPPSALYGLLLSAAGERPLGMQVTQLIATAEWVHKKNGASNISLATRGIRSQITALAASALEPTYFSEITVREGMRTLGYLLDKGIHYQDVPDLFCFELFKYFDVDILCALSGDTRITQQYLD